MDKLNLPYYKFRIVQIEKNKSIIFDPIRKKEALLTPEEWVRQNIVRFLVEDRDFPQSLISIESGLIINRLSRRYDVLVYDRNGNTLVLIECKAPKININQDTFDQIIAYNHKMLAPYLLVTNGLKHYFCKHEIKLNQYIFLENIPSFNDL
jgi:hypothetical protein